MCPFVVFMTSSIPDSFNLDELQAMLENAPSEDETSECDCSADADSHLDDLEAAMTALNQVSEDPLTHKLVVIQILHNLFDWHDAVGTKCISHGESKPAQAWLRDAGKFQAIMNILQTISVDEDDFTVVRK